MAKITLFEFNPRGRIQVGPSGPDGEGLFSAEIDETGEEEAVEEAEDSGLSITTVLLPLVILAAIGVAVRMLTGEDEEEEEEAEIEAEESGPIDRFTSTTE
ncbi:hypothetical protein ACFQH2_10795 [Natronoarchaeum sp. GCM10025703]|uniref:hypothetical protein n=1 Tax=unclassified Natronoarchaeum TaxID=2620183 RepID=UPI00361CBE14